MDNRSWARKWLVDVWRVRASFLVLAALATTAFLAGAIGAGTAPEDQAGRWVSLAFFAYPVALIAGYVIELFATARAKGSMQDALAAGMRYQLEPPMLLVLLPCYWGLMLFLPCVVAGLLVDTIALWLPLVVLALLQVLMLMLAWLTWVLVVLPIINLSATAADLIARRPIRPFGAMVSALLLMIVIFATAASLAGLVPDEPHGPRYQQQSVLLVRIVAGLVDPHASSFWIWLTRVTAVVGILLVLGIIAVFGSNGKGRPSTAPRPSA